MQNYNSEFFDEFKRLDKLCREIYGRSADNKLGVTLYLEDMDSKWRYGSTSVEGWTVDYHRLKHLRGIRNELAHSPNTFAREMCSYDDVEFVRYFYSRIMNGEDPLSLYRKVCGSAKDRGVKAKANTGNNVRVTVKKVRSALGIIRLIKRIIRLFSK